MKRTIYDSRHAACLLWVIALYVLCLPVHAYGGFIKTAVSCRHKVEDTSIDIEIDIANRGNAVAYGVSATVFIDHWVEKYDGLGNNPPGGKISLKIRHTDPKLKKGMYVVVIRIAFEEEGGRPHQVYHVFDLPVKMDGPENRRPCLTAHADLPAFNTKAFWKKRGEILLFMQNGCKEIIRPYVCLYLPAGFVAGQSVLSCELSPGEERETTISLDMDASAEHNRFCRIVVWYEQDGVHYSRLIESELCVEEKPIFFKWYLVLAGAVLVMLSVVASYINRRR